MEFLARESLMLMGLRIKKERKKNPHTAKDSRGIGGGVESYNGLINTVFIYSTIRQFVFYKSFIFMPL